jgi:hypothetical protein
MDYVTAKAISQFQQVDKPSEAKQKLERVVLWLVQERKRCTGQDDYCDGWNDALALAIRYLQVVSEEE